jgi:hypothetical protein
LNYTRLYESLLVNGQTSYSTKKRSRNLSKPEIWFQNNFVRFQVVQNIEPVKSRVGLSDNNILLLKILISN